MNQQAFQKMLSEPDMRLDVWIREKFQLPFNGHRRTLEIERYGKQNQKRGAA